MISKSCLWFMVLSIIVCACGDGVDIQPVNAQDNTCYVLNWTQDPYYEDNTSLNVLTDIKYYRIYVSDYPWIDNGATEVAQLAGSYTDNDGVLTAYTSFDMSLLRPYGITTDNGAKYIFMTSETHEGGASEFSDVVQWGTAQLNMEVVQ